MEEYIDKALPHIKKWWFSVVCIPFIWVLLDQFWMALKWEISFSYMYSYPLLLSPFFFLIDNFLLIVHEAGHTFFGVFGWRFLTILGGTLFQILLPFLIFVYGWYNRKRVAAQLGLLLTGYAWIDSSAYAADALYRKAPLIGNLPKSAHDFGNMLRQLNILDYYMEVAWLFYIAGVITMLIFLGWPLLEREKTEYVKLEMDL